MQPASSTRQLLTVALVVSASSLAAAIAAGAQEYCVACNGPDAVYRCVIEQSVPGGMPLKMLCLSTLARDGGHATCTVRGGTVFDCNGPVRRLDAKAANQALGPPASASTPSAAQMPPVAAAPVAPGGLPPPAQPELKPKPPLADEPPKTVEELAKRVSKSSGESLGKAGSAITSSTAKAWGCLTSLFKSC